MNDKWLAATHSKDNKEQSEVVYASQQAYGRDNSHIQPLLYQETNAISEITNVNSISLSDKVFH